MTPRSRRENLRGSGFDDILSGDSGDNFLGGAGGEDTFRFGEPGFGQDIISDFLAGSGVGRDVLELIPRKSQSNSPYFSAAFTVSSHVSLAYRWQQVRQVEVGGIAARRA